MDGAAINPMGVDAFSLVFGLGFVLVFGYWCTDFLVVQRAMIAKNVNEARLTPIIASIPKILMPGNCHRPRNHTARPAKSI